MPEDNSALSLTDRYEILTLLGQGGMSLVYKAKDKMLDRIVAIKTLTVKSLSEQQYVQFQQEARALSNLKHGCIMEILDFGMTKSGKPYMVLEYIEGTSLSKHLESLGPLPVEIALPIFSDLCQALSHAHQKGILHRDIKPSNIILIRSQSGYYPKIIDFGLASFDTEETAKSSNQDNIAGSPPYMSPEQIANQELDKRSDLYSLGCTMYEALVGVVPYSGSSAFETMNMHISSPIPILPPLIENEILQAHLQGIITQLLAKEREERTQSVEALLVELEDLQTRLKELTNSMKKLAQKEAMEATAQQTVFKLEEKPKSYFKYLGLSSVAICIILLGLVYFYETKHGAFQEKDVKLSSDFTETAKKFNEKRDTIVQNATTKTGKNMTQNLAKDISRNMETILVRNTTTDRPAPPDLKKMPKEDFALDLSTTELSKSNLSDLANLPNLKMLNLSNSNIQPEQLKQIAALKKLQKLNIRINPELTRADFLQLLPLKNLNSLSVESCNLNSQSLIQISKLSQLAELSLEHNPGFNKDVIAALSKMPNLKTLFIGSTISDPEILKDTVKIKGLKTLWMDFTSINDDTFYYLISNLPNLEKISVSHSDITLKSIRASLRHPKLKKVICCACKELEKDGAAEALELLNRSQKKIQFIYEAYSREALE